MNSPDPGTFGIPVYGYTRMEKKRRTNINENLKEVREVQEEKESKGKMK
jgi:hypothetical protein